MNLFMEKSKMMKNNRLSVEMKISSSKHNNLADFCIINKLSHAEQEI